MVVDAMPTIKLVLKITDRVWRAICMRSLLGPDIRANRLCISVCIAEREEEKKENHDDRASKRELKPSSHTY